VLPQQLPQLRQLAPITTRMRIREDGGSQRAQLATVDALC
jgi:hypothetical protein